TVACRTRYRQKQTPVPFPERLNQLIRNAEVIHQLIDQSINQSTNQSTYSCLHFGQLRFALPVILSSNLYNPHPSVSRWRPSWFSCVQGGSTSWELLRKETKLRLDHLDLLVAFIKDAASASRSRSTPTQHQH
uniref:Uncharacterized protein n=1 Tax=Mastacembelus armatus TaxID=205130 RepID=A0A7N8WZY4_9TELE